MSRRKASPKIVIRRNKITVTLRGKKIFESKIMTLDEVREWVSTIR